MFPTPADLKNNLLNVLKLFRRQEGSTFVFETDNVSIAKSFIPVLFLTPVFVAYFLGAILRIDPEFKQGSIIVPGFILYLIYLSLFPVIVHRMGYETGFRRLLVCRNWILAFNLLVALTSGFGILFATIGSAVSLYLIIVNWFMIKDSLEVTGWTALKLYVIEIFVFTVATAYFLATLDIDVEKYVKSVN